MIKPHIIKNISEFSWKCPQRSSVYWDYFRKRILKMSATYRSISPRLTCTLLVCRKVKVICCLLYKETVGLTLSAQIIIPLNRKTQKQQSETIWPMIMAYSYVLKEETRLLFILIFNTYMKPADSSSLFLDLSEWSESGLGAILRPTNVITSPTFWFIKSFLLSTYQ